MHISGIVLVPYSEHMFGTSLCINLGSSKMGLQLFCVKICCSLFGSRAYKGHVDTRLM